MQLSFVPESDIQVLADDACGSIVYRRELFAETIVALWFERLRASVKWRTEQRLMYDRMVDVPRLFASFSLAGGGVPEPVVLMRPAVEQFCGVVFASAGLNLYRDGNDSVAPHGDHVVRGPDEAPVALVSLGAVRRMTIRSRFKPRRTLDLDLEPGSLLVMSNESHFNYDHGIPKTRDRTGPRISVAFRGPNAH